MMMKQRFSLLSGEPVAMPDQKPAPKPPDPGAEVAALAAELRQVRSDLIASREAQSAMQQTIAETRARMDTLQRLIEAKPASPPVVNIERVKPTSYEVVVTQRRVTDDRLQRCVIQPISDAPNLRRKGI
jgi:hypothetical protein